MNAGSKSKESSTDTTPTNVPGHNLSGKRPAGDPPTLSESEYLEQQVKESSKAVSVTSRLVAANLGHAVNPATWTRHHPIISLTSAAAGGFAAAKLAFPSQERRVLRRLKAIERIANRQDRNARKPNAEQKRGMMATLIDEAFRTIRPLAMSAIATAMSERLRRPEPQDGNTSPSGPDPVPDVKAQAQSEVEAGA